MQIPNYIDKLVDDMQPCKKKEVWELLKKTDNVYIEIPSIDCLNFRYKTLNNHLRMKPVESLEYSSKYYHHVNDIYQKYDFILSKDFFECSVHPNEYDAIYVTRKTRNNANRICEKIDDRIKKLEKK